MKLVLSHRRDDIDVAREPALNHALLPLGKVLWYNKQTFAQATDGATSHPSLIARCWLLELTVVSS